MSLIGRGASAGARSAYPDDVPDCRWLVVRAKDAGTGFGRSVHCPSPGLNSRQHHRAAPITGAATPADPARQRERRYSTSSRARSIKAALAVAVAPESAGRDQALMDRHAAASVMAGGREA